MAGPARLPPPNMGGPGGCQQVRAALWRPPPAPTRLPGPALQASSGRALLITERHPAPHTMAIRKMGHRQRLGHHEMQWLMCKGLAKDLLAGGRLADAQVHSYLHQSVRFNNADIMVDNCNHMEIAKRNTFVLNIAIPNDLWLRII